MRNLAWKIHYNKKKHEKMNMKTKIIIFLCHLCAYTLYLKYFIYDIERFFSEFYMWFAPMWHKKFLHFSKKAKYWKMCLMCANHKLKKVFLSFFENFMHWLKFSILVIACYKAILRRYDQFKNIFVFGIVQNAFLKNIRRFPRDLQHENLKYFYEYFKGKLLLSSFQLVKMFKIDQKIIFEKLKVFTYNRHKIL